MPFSFYRIANNSFYNFWMYDTIPNTFYLIHFLNFMPAVVNLLLESVQGKQIQLCEKR